MLLKHSPNKVTVKPCSTGEKNDIDSQNPNFNKDFHFSLETGSWGYRKVRC